MININNDLIQDEFLQASILDSALSINNAIFMIVLFIIVLLFLYNVSPYFYNNIVLDDISIKYISEFKVKETYNIESSFHKELVNKFHSYINNK